MGPRKTILIFAAALGLAFSVPAVAQSPEPLPVDPATGLVMDDNWQLVAAHCGACHSTRLVTQNRGSRDTWLYLIRWMQETQGLWPFNEPTEQILLDYLATNYGPLAGSRRAPLPASLLPPNPYATD